MAIGDIHTVSTDNYDVEYRDYHPSETRDMTADELDDYFLDNVIVKITAVVDNYPVQPRDLSVMEMDEVISAVVRGLRPFTLGALPQARRTRKSRSR